MILALGDLHYPFHNRQALSDALDILSQETRRCLSQKEKIYVVQIGDLFDQYGFTKFPKKNLIRPEKELEQARFHAERMWFNIKKISSKIECHQILGNHDLRAAKRCQEKLPEAQVLIKNSILELYRFEGVELHENPTLPLWINDIRFIHGYKKHGTHMTSSQHKTVVGHSHKGGIVYSNAELPGGRKRLIYELNCGWMGDENRFPDIFGYGAEKATGWTIGVGLIDSYGPRFIPF